MQGVHMTPERIDKRYLFPAIAAVLWTFFLVLFIGILLGVGGPKKPDSQPDEEMHHKWHPSK